MSASVAKRQSCCFRMSSQIEIPEGATPSAAAMPTPARGLPSRRLSVAPMMDWTEEGLFS